MNLIIAILIALNSLASADAYNDDYINTHQNDLNKAQIIFDNHWYTEIDGGVIIDPNVSL